MIRDPILVPICYPLLGGGGEEDGPADTSQTAQCALG
jgi:hypothetical protein